MLVSCTWVSLVLHNSHAIVSSAVGPEYYVGITSFVDKTQLEPGCSVLLHNKVGEGLHSCTATFNMNAPITSSMGNR